MASEVTWKKDGPVFDAYTGVLLTRLYNVGGSPGGGELRSISHATSEWERDDLRELRYDTGGVVLGDGDDGTERFAPLPPASPPPLWLAPLPPSPPLWDLPRLARPVRFASFEEALLRLSLCFLRRRPMVVERLEFVPFARGETADLPSTRTSNNRMLRVFAGTFSSVRHLIKHADYIVKVST